MTARRTVGRVLAAGLTALLVGVVAAPPALAAPAPATQVLCSDLAHPCSIQLGEEQREGAVGWITVTGKPGMATEVRLFRIDVKGADPVGLTPLGDPVPVTLDGRGFGQVDYPFTPLAPDEDGGWVLASLADTVWTDPAEILGSVASMGGRRPTILGDGYGTSKPVGQALDLTLTNVIGGTVFAVDYLGDDGGWHNVTAPGQRDAAATTLRDPVRNVTYTIPQGLQAKPYTFRLHNVSDPSADDQTWQVLPSTTAVPEPRRPLLQMPPLGTRVAGSAVTASHPTALVLAGLGLAAAAGAVLLVAWPARAASRRLDFRGSAA